MLCIKDSIMFPFMKAASGYAKISIDSLAEFDICNKIDTYLFEVFSKKYHDVIDNEDIETVMKRFFGTALVVNQIKKQRLTYKFAEVEATHYISRLQYIMNKEGMDSFGLYFSMIFEEVYGTTNFIKKSGKRYLVKVPQYLQLLTKCGDKSELRLIHQTLVRGHVVFDIGILFELLKGGIRAFLVKKIDGMNIDTKQVSKFHPPVILPESVKKLIQKYEYIDIYSSVHKTVSGLENKKDYDTKQLIQNIVKLKGHTPPCIKYLIDKADTEHHLTHSERILISTFMFSQDKDEEWLIDNIFSKLSDWNEKITRYQLKSLKKYKIMSCNKIKIEEMCHTDNNRCNKISNPFFY